MILIIDDDISLATSLEKVFRYAGLDAVSVSGGVEALSMLHLRKPKLIVLDLAMPTMDGMMVLRAIRKDESFKSVPIVIYTADFSRLKEQEAINAGAQAYIVKGTMGWDSLVARIAELLAEPAVKIRFGQ